MWVGLAMLVLGLASLVVPIPRAEGSSVDVGGVSLGVENTHNERLSPIISAVLILTGAGVMIAGRKKTA
jgi:hypothetical protein